MLPDLALVRLGRLGLVHRPHGVLLRTLDGLLCGGGGGRHLLLERRAGRVGAGTIVLHLPLKLLDVALVALHQRDGLGRVLAVKLAQVGLALLHRVLKLLLHRLGPRARLGRLRPGRRDLRRRLPLGIVDLALERALHLHRLELRRVARLCQLLLEVGARLRHRRHSRRLDLGCKPRLRLGLLLCELLTRRAPHIAQFGLQLSVGCPLALEARVQCDYLLFELYA
mmetsp:Transcript_27567/g.75026  ORF Transcript_27567/g.75026 Transcript_27567/m.75026 type:complete len:225 (-) Transcript_27567:2481-3155(-)